ncbi:MAG: c-type cytochrome domain-containing protein [Acidobacteriota bacterium]
MKVIDLLPLGVACVALALSARAQDTASKKPANEPVSYFKQIQPILQRQCQGCHQPASKQGELLLTSFEGFKAGGGNGPSFVPGQPEVSLVVARLKGEKQPRMPFGSDPLPPEQIDLFTRWIAEGGRDDTPSAARETVVAGRAAAYHVAPVTTALAYSPDGSTLAVSGYREILLHQADGSGLIDRLLGISDRIQSLVYSPDGATLAAVGGSAARFGEVQLWDVATRKLRRSVMSTNDTLFGAAFSPDGRRLAFGSTDKTIRLISTETGQELLKMTHHDHWVLGTTFSLDGKRLVSVGRDRAAKLTELGSGAFIENLNLLRGELTCLARYPRRDAVLIGGEDRVPYLYSLQRPRQMRIADDSTLIRAFEKQPDTILAVAFSPDGRRIAVGGAASQVHVYDTETGTRLAALTGHQGGIYTIAFHPSGERVATGGFDGRVRIYEVESGKLFKEFVPVPLEAQ